MGIVERWQSKDGGFCDVFQILSCERATFTMPHVTAANSDVPERVEGRAKERKNR